MTTEPPKVCFRFCLETVSFLLHAFGITFQTKVAVEFRNIQFYYHVHAGRAKISLLLSLHLICLSFRTMSKIVTVKLLQKN